MAKKAPTPARTSIISAPAPSALQRMLVQEAGGKILLLPAWPADWDADFKLHLTQRRRAHRNREGWQAERVGH